VAASTITRDVWTDDTGTPAAPNADGTILNNSVLQNHIYARIDAMFAGAGAYATLTFGGLIAAEGFGTHAFSAGGTGGNVLSVRNTSAGTGNFAQVKIGNDAADNTLRLNALSSTWTTSGINTQGGGTIACSGVGGLSIAADHASGVIRFYTGGSTEQARLTAAGEWRVGSGSVSAPAYSFTADPDSGFWWDTSSVYIGCAINGAEILRVNSASGIVLAVRDYGAGVIPAGIVLNQNSNGSNPVAGWAQFITQGALGYYVWVDAAGDMRIGTLANLQADNGGTVVGTQTSQRAVKDLLGPYDEDDAALALIRATPLHRFRYKSGAYNGQEFVGIVADDSPAFAMDAGRVFNPISAFGYTVAAMRELARRLERVEAPGR